MDRSRHVEADEFSEHRMFSRSDLKKAQAADLIRAIATLALQKEHGVSPAEYFAKTWPLSISRDVITRAFETPFHKAAILPGSGTDATWASPISPFLPASLVDAFVPLVTAQSAVLQLALRRVPLKTAVPSQTTDASYSWVAEDRSKPVSRFTFATTVLNPLKVSGIVVLSKELMRLALPGAISAIQTALADGLASFVDRSFLDATSTAIAGQRPGSVTSGVAATTVTGTLSEQIGALVAAFYAALPQASAQTTLIVSPATAGRLAASALLPDLTVAGGSAFGLRVVTTPQAANTAVILDPTRIVTARDDAPTIDLSEHAALQADDTPTDPMVAATILVSLWQMNLVGIRCEWMITWSVLPNAVAWAAVV